MNLTNFVQTNQDPQRPSGTCEAGGIPAHCFFDRSDPARAWVTLRFSMEAGAPLPPVAQNRTELVIAGTAVPVRAMTLKCGAGTLQGSLDPALVEAVAGPVSEAPAPEEKPAPGGPAPSAEDPDADDKVIVLSKEHAAAKREQAQHAARVDTLESETADLRARLEAAEQELAGAGETAAALAERCAEARQRIRDALDAEEAA